MAVPMPTESQGRATRFSSSQTLLFLFSLFNLCSGSKPLLVYEINLDLPPEERFAGLFKLNPDFNTTVWQFYNESFRDNAPLTNLLYGISEERGPENDEQQAEIESLASMSGLPLPFVASIQMLYELQTVMVPIVNVTKPGDSPTKYAFPRGYEALETLPWRQSAGCTGIIATTADGSVSHARNLDFAPEHIMMNLVYDARFTRGGQELFRSQMIAGYTMVVTAASMVEDGYAIERNTRFIDHPGGFQTTMENLVSGVPLNGWTLRKILESEATYDAAINAVSKAQYASTEYTIISGVRKGTIISRNPEGVAYMQTLGEENFEERSDYIIVTNFDFFWHDIREWFDPTGGYGVGHPRRVEAQKLLNSTELGTLTSEYLFEVISSKGVFAGGSNDHTIFQAIINIEKGLWNVSQPTIIPE